MFDVQQNLLTLTCFLVLYSKQLYSKIEHYIYVWEKSAVIVIFFSSRLTANTKLPFTFSRQAVTKFIALDRGYAGFELFSSFVNINGMDFKKNQKTFIECGAFMKSHSK